MILVVKGRHVFFFLGFFFFVFFWGGGGGGGVGRSGQYNIVISCLCVCIYIHPNLKVTSSPGLGITTWTVFSLPLFMLTFSMPNSTVMADKDF